MNPRDMTDEAMVHYAHSRDPKGQRFQQYKKDPLPVWAVDVQDVEVIKDLTDDELWVRVAILLGWRRSTWGEQGYLRGTTDGEVWIERGSNLCRPLYDNDDGDKYPFPRFPYDLDAAHFMESHIPIDKEAHYGRLLEFIVARDKNGPRAVWHATARQRSEAFVETMEGR